MLFAADYPFLQIMATMLVFFGWVVAIGLIFVVLADLYRRPDASGWSKAGWTVLVILLPFAGVLAYLVVHGRGMAERREQESDRRWSGVGGSAAGPAQGDGRAAEIEHAKRLLDIGAIDDAEYARLKHQVLL